MNRGEIYRNKRPIAERGHKPGFYLIVSRDSVATNENLSTVICAPIYSEIIGLKTEVVLGQDDGLPSTSAARCDFLMLLLKSHLTGFVATLRPHKVAELNWALIEALAIPVTPTIRPGTLHSA